MLEQLQAKVTEAGMGGRVSTWAVPCNMLFVEAGVEYAKKVLEGQTDGVLDDAVLRETIQECAGDVEMTVDYYKDDEGNAKENHYLVMADFITFE